MFSELDSTLYFINVLVFSVLILPVYCLLKKALYRRLILTLLGGYLLYTIAPRLLLFYIAFWSVVYLLSSVLKVFFEKKFEAFVFAALLLIVAAPMVAWKIWYIDFSINFNLLGNGFLGLISGFLQDIDYSKAIIIPIGLSFATFRALDLLVKCYLGAYDKLSLEKTFFYGFFPFVQVVGPIIEISEVDKASCQTKKITPDDIFEGGKRIVLGFFKTVVLASLLMDSVSVFGGYQTVGATTVWLYLLLYMWFFYINFSGYSDLAIGASRIFGFQIKENFNNPYFKQNISDFWNSWHMSLSRFAQRNAFVPLGGYRERTRDIATLATMMLIALWHDLSLGMIVFGVYHAAGLVVQRHFSRAEVASKIPDNLYTRSVWVLMTNLFVALSFPLLALKLNDALPFYSTLLGGL